MQNKKTFKIVILKHGGGELANQLWNYISIMAFGLEQNIPVCNPSFFEYHSFFRFLSKESFVTKIRAVFFRQTRRRSHIINKIARFKYSIISKIISKIHKQCVFSSENVENRSVFLPPTFSLPDKFKRCGNIYFTGWLFRNPIGLKKFRNELISAFRPNNHIEKKIQNIIGPFRKKYEKIIGIHIRQADYKIFKDGKYLIPQDRIREIINEYVRENIIDTNKTLFLITSDGPIDDSLFKNLNIYISGENSVVDLFLLSKTDVILGSDSSFGALASWFGDIPHIIFKKESIDWKYYSNKTSFFENKFSTLIQY